MIDERGAYREGREKAETGPTSSSAGRQSQPVESVRHTMHEVTPFPIEGGVPAVARYYRREKQWPAASLARRTAIVPLIEAYRARRRRED